MNKFRVLIVDDSITQREIFRRLLADDPDLCVVAEARNGIEAIQQVKSCSPDVVLMDIHMPEMDGIQATAEIMRQCPVPIVIASATLKKRDVDLAMHAYEAGAVSVIEKPEGAVLLYLQKIAPELRRELIAASKAKIRRTRDTSSSRNNSFPGTATRVDSRPSLRSVSVIGVCASTGGPPVLLKILSDVPKPFSIPILLVQHISRSFEDGFARWLSGASGHPVNLASSGQRLEPGVWISPGGRHLTVTRDARIDLPPAESSDIHCPSGNPLFESLANIFGPRAMGIQLTGMGDDGSQGLNCLKQQGGITIIQEESTCMIWGMPKAAKENGSAMYELCPEEIARMISGTGNLAYPVNRSF